MVGLVNCPLRAVNRTLRAAYGVPFIFGGVLGVRTPMGKSK